MSYSTEVVYGVDKDSDLFGHALMDPCNDFFDEYLTFDSIDNESTLPILPESTAVVKPISDSHSAGTSLSLQDHGTRGSISELPKREPYELKSTEVLNRHKPARNHQIYLEGSGRASISDTELLSLEGIKLQSPRICDVSPSLPASPIKSPGGTLRRTKRFIKSLSKAFPLPQAPRDSDCRQRSPIRKATVPAKMMGGSQYSEQNIEQWSQRLAVEAAKFDFGFAQSSVPLSPPPSARVSDSSDHSNSSGVMANVDNAFAWDHPVPPYAARLHTPQTSPGTAGQGFQNQNMQQVSANNMIYQSSDDSSSNMWVQHNMSSGFDNFGLHTPFVDEVESTPLWWNHAATTPISQPAPAGYHRNPQQNTKSLAMQLQSELAYNANELALSPSNLPSGLMIQMPHSPHPQSYVVTSPMAQAGPIHPHQQQQHQQQGYFAPHHSSQPLPSARHRYSQSQPIPPARQFQKSPMRKSRSRGDLTESPSPPTNYSSPSHTPLTPRSVSYHVSKRRSMSRKHSEASMQPKTPKAAGSGIDFVNFTPHDSMKILTGVAPSGSSKTKARREKEAMDKRRRLSQAAVRAVQAAGGSIESLVEEGLFV